MDTSTRSGERIETGRLTLYEATAAVLQADLAGRVALAATLGCRVTEEWPPEMYPRAKVERNLGKVADPAEQGWWSWYAVERESATLVGMATFLGRPQGGEVEVGYSICRSAQRRGFASEAVAGMLARAFATPGIERVCAITTSENAGSIAVLRKAGFEPAAHPQAGEICFERFRR